MGRFTWLAVGRFSLLQRYVAQVQWFPFNIRTKKKGEQKCSGPFTAEELQQALYACVHTAQATFFDGELRQAAAIQKKTSRQGIIPSQVVSFSGSGRYNKGRRKAESPGNSSRRKATDCSFSTKSSNRAHQLELSSLRTAPWQSCY